MPSELALLSFTTTYALVSLPFVREVRAAAHFLFRAEPNVLDELPPLRAAAVGSTTTRRATAKKPDDAL